jgi:DNA repair protein RecO (recombination protein O)
MSLYRTNVIVLKSRNLGEADRILMLLSEDLGKFQAVVKGARRERSRFVGSTLSFNYLKAMFFTGKNLDTLSQAELIHPFSKLREDLTTLAYASFWVELIDGFVPERVEVKEVFHFLLAAFLTLEQTADPALLNLAFEIRLLNYLGYQPELDVCTACRQPVDTNAGLEIFYFSANIGGVICGNCRLQHSGLIQVNPAQLRLMKTLATTDIRKLAMMNGGSDDYKIIGTILREFIEVRLERPLKSRVFLDNLLSL